MGIFDKLFGTKEIAEAGSKAIGDIVDSVSTGVDKFIYTKAEKAVDERLKNEQEFRFQNYEQEVLLKVLEKDLEFYKINGEDRQNARELAKEELKNEDIFIKRFRYYFATGWSVLTCSYVGFITFSNIPKDNQRFVDIIIGFLIGTVISTIIGFFYGSSQGSSMKDMAINKLIEKN